MHDDCPRQTAQVPTVLVIDDDQDIGLLVEAVLIDEGFSVSRLARIDPELVARAVGQLEPDCVLLDSNSPRDFGDGWSIARWLTTRERPVPVVMFTAHAAAVREAQINASERSRSAEFAGVLEKPFILEDLVRVVTEAAGRSVPFDRSSEADTGRTQALVTRLESGGATELEPSRRREWVTFRAPSGALVQLYWWQARGAYICGRYDPESAAMELLGTFADREMAVACTLAA